MTVVVGRSPGGVPYKRRPLRGGNGVAGLAGMGPAERGVVEALTYADVFDWPLTPAEIHRYLPVAATLDEVESALQPGSPALRLVERSGDLAMLRGRSELTSVRRQRERRSAVLWPRAHFLARVVGRLPFVRMVAVTGSLSVRAARDGDDVDLFVVTADGRLWLARAMTMLVVRAARPLGLRLCPNYLIAASAIDLRDRSLFTARELVQMVPVTGAEVYAALMARNDWYREFLPNAEATPIDGESRRNSRFRRLLESALRSPVADRLERWEMNRKSRQLSAISASAETQYDATCCKGHADEHGLRVMAAFEARLDRLDRKGEVN